METVTNTMPDWFILFASCVCGFLSLVATLAIPWAFKVHADVSAIKTALRLEIRAHEKRIGRLEKDVEGIGVRVERLEAAAG